MVTQRDNYWDILKGILIFLVVLGHTGTALGERWLSVIYSFHMPLFVFISGYFSRRKEVTAFVGGVRRISSFFFLFHALYLMYDMIGGMDLTAKRIMTPSFGLWYILSLCLWRCVPQYMYKILNQKAYIVLAGAIALSLIVGFIPISKEFSFQRAFVFLPFFIAGHIACQHRWADWLRRQNKSVAWAFLVVVLALVYWYMPIFYGSTHYSNVWEQDLFLRLAQLLVAGMLCGLILVVAPHRQMWLASLGRSTLVVYLLHPPLILIGKRLLTFVGVVLNPLWAIIITAVVIVIIYSVRNWRVCALLK